MNVCVYSRVACNDGLNLAMQTAKLRHYAEQAGYTVIGTYSECESGLSLERPTLQALTQFVLENRPDLVLVNDISRISRRMDMVQAYIDLLNDFEVGLLCLQERILFSRKCITTI